MQNLFIFITVYIHVIGLGIKISIIPDFVDPNEFAFDECNCGIGFIEEGYFSMI
ncbi:MAG: hypothetical protein IPG55_13350 [Saprospiraceae bacterium]|nr:hypothetical protein [Candidatus Defluviibacterium haderslevense]MBK7245088.1 hypothetical protein [Candidatus Defluviibacterium haderslevense]